MLGGSAATDGSQYHQDCRGQKQKGGKTAAKKVGSHAGCGDYGWQGGEVAERVGERWYGQQRRVKQGRGRDGGRRPQDILSPAAD